MLLDYRDPVDAFVVGEGLVVRGDQANDFGLTHVLEGIDAQMAVEEKILAGSYGRALRRAAR